MTWHPSLMCGTLNPNPNPNPDSDPDPDPDPNRYLIELSMDGNPISEFDNVVYRAVLIDKIGGLKHLDLKRVVRFILTLTLTLTLILTLTLTLANPNLCSN